MDTKPTRELILLLDYRNFFYMSVRHNDASMDLERIRCCFRDEGWSLDIRKYPDIDFRSEDYRGRLILYQSSDDRDLFYKSYIEDVLLGLELQGAVLIPAFHYFRAHHNKLFMEILRDLSPLNEIKNIRSRGFGTYEDFVRNSSHFPSQLVFKPSEGAGSSGVRLLRDDASKRKYIEKASRSLHPVDALKNIVKSYIRTPYVSKSNHRRKFIVQNLIPDLQNDYKILVYGDKYYALFRRNRKHDFRASGSGLFEYRENLPDGLLDFSERVFNSFKTPFLSMDIGFNGSDFFLIEFQFLLFGNYTLEKSSFYFTRENSRWKTVRETSVLEEEFVRSVIRYVDQAGLA